MSILIKMTDDWLEATDQGLHTGALFLDLRKAFDVVNHDLLVAKLQLYGYPSSTLVFDLLCQLSRDFSQKKFTTNNIVVNTEQSYSGLHSQGRS